MHQVDSNVSLDHLVLQLVNIFLVTQNKKTADDARAKFLESLEKKKNKNSPTPKEGRSAGSKVSGGQATGGAPGRFQRKSGSSGSAAG